MTPEAGWNEKGGGRFAIVHAGVIAMDSPEVLADHSVVIEGGRIRMVAPSSQLVLEGIPSLDASSLFLMPGLADMHVHHWDLGTGCLFLANGVTCIRNMSGTPAHLVLAGSPAQGGAGPRVVTTSPTIDGKGPDGLPTWAGSILLEDPADAAPLVDSFVEAGYRQVKTLSWVSPPVLRALGKASLERGIRLVGHCPVEMTYEEAISAGMTCFEHLSGISKGHLAGGIPMPPPRSRHAPLDAERATLIIDHLDLDAIARLAGGMAGSQIWNCPTTVIFRHWAEEPAGDDPSIRYMPAGARAVSQALDRLRREGSGLPDGEAGRAFMARYRERIRQVLGILDQEGAPLVVGTDTANPGLVPGFSIHDEIAEFLASGLSPFRALRAATSEAARFLGEEDEWGRVHPGMRADLVLCRQNPLSDPATLRRPEAVFVNGDLFSRSDLDALLAAREDQAGSQAPHASASPEALVEQMTGSSLGSDFEQFDSRA